MGNPLQSLFWQDPNQAMMGQATQAMNNPIAQPAPAPGGQIDPSIHPVIAKIIQDLAGGAQAYGWTGQSPQERVERTQMQQQKAETLARMAQTGAYQTGELGIRQQLADTANKNATTKATDVARKQTWDEFKQGMAKQQEADKVDHNKAIEALGQGRIDEASRRNDAYLESVKNRYQVAEQNVGLGYGKLAVQQDLANIMRYRSSLEAISTSQRGTDMGIKATQEMAKMESDHWLQSMLGMGGVGASQGAVQQAVPLPGATQPNMNPGAPPAAPGASPAPNIPPNKVNAKRSQKASPDGATHDFIPGKGIIPITPTQGSNP
jgi:hypothetical protein